MVVVSLPARHVTTDPDNSLLLTLTNNHHPYPNPNPTIYPNPVATGVVVMQDVSILPPPLDTRWEVPAIVTVSQVR